ncbi:TIGR01777 family oxidoreductase [Bacillus sp. USDA818B3_A]|uniref:TIGR01777 family oxidoreductase n=1 Tax=Bacillus sp. USDA818B3_A TaxID=2698834 RepID=UPI001370B918|nr:TIGR01777 family oxidoreductase [Bacillus sp. USDA818B3_A]
MKIVITGGSGFIGQKLTDFFLERGHELVVLTRKKVHKTEERLTYVNWMTEGSSPENEIKHADAIINLAGVSINKGRWDANHQKQIYESRMKATDELIRMINHFEKKPSVLINASAIGVYPASLHEVYTEGSIEAADDFLGRTVLDWEKKAGQVERMGIRPVFMRFGVVLGKEGGALPLMVLPYKLFAGGTVGSGEQWVSWVHVQDVIRAIDFALQNQRLRGPVNVTAPTPVRMKEFGKRIGTVLHRPHWLPVPSFVMKIVLGKKSALVLEGQYVVPAVLQKEEFEFTYPSLDDALRDLL